MSYIPAKKMPHITALSGEFDPETGKIIHLHTESENKIEQIAGTITPRAAWIAGAAGAGLAAIALGAFFTLRSSSPKKPTRRPARTAKRTATPRKRTTTAKRKTASA